MASVAGTVTGMAIDTHYARRKLYWVIANDIHSVDGMLYSMDLDASTLSSSIVSLTATVGQVRVPLAVIRVVTGHSLI